MSNHHWRASVLAIAFLSALGSSQTAEQKPDAATVLNTALKASSLTSDGRPFHAVMEIGKSGDPYSGRIEFWWVNSSKYRITITSPDFKQVKIVNGDRTSEADDGDYYPRWLENFVLAVMDPLSMKKNLGENSFFMGDISQDNLCLRRDDRTNGITDQMTYGQACFKGPERRIESVRTFNEFLYFQDWKQFGDKQIPRTYETFVLDEVHVTGRFTTLEELTQPDEKMFTVTSVTPPEKMISTTLIPEKGQESLVQQAPTAMQWPSVREGKTDGYMIVFVRTDRNGQVRESAPYTSDQPALMATGMQQALQYKFKPLAVDGVPQQMEIPLVVHFSTKIENPIPELDDAATRKIIRGCSLPHEMSDPASSGQQIVITFQIQSDGRLMTLGSSDRKIPVMTLYQQFRGCNFGQYKQNGVPTAYHANMTVTAR